MESSWGVCPNTMNVFTDETGELETDTGNIVANKSSYIIRSLPAEEHYKNKPYVTGFPFIRSYFEVPLISPLGYVIGGYCIVDNKFRDFGEDTRRILAEVSSTIMAHLERVRRQHNQNRSEKLIRGLDTFIQEETNMRLSRRESTWTNTSTSRSSDLDAPALEMKRKDSIATIAATAAAAEPEAIALPAQQIAAASSSTAPSDLPITSQALNESADGHAMQHAFERSAHLIREAMSMDGLVFLDACPVGFASRDASLSKDQHLDPFASSDTYFMDQQRSSEFAPILASSTIVQDMESPLRIPEDLLYRTISRYKQGYVFCADEFGVFDKRFSFSKSIDNFSARSGSRSPEADASELFEHFPGACSIIFLPMWHFQKEKWFAAAIGWTSDPQKSFDLSDTTYLSAFANSITAEILRLETLAVSKAKSDFISSISHELRSPLHGILATTELLRETISSREERSLLEMVSSSGTTLLDTMDHLLDHAKINRRKGGKARGGKAQANGHGGEMVRPCNLAELVEGVVQDVVMGHTRFTAMQAGLSSSVADPTGSQLEQELPPIVTIHIQAGQDWNMSLEVGAWKRVILNLLGNALKYTPGGSIEIRISQLNGNIVFAVQDTGIGMSSEYQKYHLYSPFRQENPLSVGTGLGLSIVQQIVNTQGGVIDVKSQKGVGTLVTVTVPVPEQGVSLQEDTSIIGEGLSRLKGLTLGIISLSKQPHKNGSLSPAQTSHARHQQLLDASVATIATEWFGMNVKAISHTESIADIYLAMETEDILQVTGDLHTLQPLVEVHGPQPSLKTAAISVGTKLRVPFGPKRLAYAFLDALDHQKESVNGIVAAGPDAASEMLNGIGHSEMAVPVREMNGLALNSNHSSTQTSVTTTPKSNSQNGLLTVSAEQSAASLSPLSPPTLPTSISPSDLAPHKPHILIVDDNPINIRILATLLKRLSLPHLSATDGLEAVNLFAAQAATSNPFDVVLMDVSMPVMDGFTATREIRAFESVRALNEIGDLDGNASRGRRARIVALTGLGSRESEVESERCGMDGFLVKPVKMGVLKELLLGEK